MLMIVRKGLFSVFKASNRGVAGRWYFLGLLSLLAFRQGGGWVAPESAAVVPNPYPSSETSVLAGKKLFGKYCWSCHGTTGNGDGPASKGLTPKPADFHSGTFQSQSDGAIFWKITEGRGAMASYKSMLKPADRWNLVNYLRTFK